MTHELGDVFRMTQLRFVVIKVFTKDNHLNVAKCHFSLLLGLLGFNFVKFSWPGMVNFLFLQENEL